MNKQKFKELYIKMNSNEKTINPAIQSVLKFEKHINNIGKSFDSVIIKDVKDYIKILIDKKENTVERIVALARYFYLINKTDIYIYFTSIFTGIGVIENIKKRTLQYSNPEIVEKIFNSIKEPPLGTPTDKIPYFTKDLMDNMIDCLPKKYQKILAGNNHNISKESMLDEKKIFEKFDSLDEYLKDRHRRKVEVLQNHCDENKVWFEQKITQEVVDFVRDNQETLSAVKKNNKLYITKIPYNPDKFLKEKDPNLKRYYACHCPFVRESILKDNINIHKDWCYCSAGFAKFPFEVIFNKELEVEMLESVLKGDSCCRFAVSI